VEDAAVVLNVVARPDPRDVDALPDDGVDYLDRIGAGVAGLRIALSLTLGHAREVDAEVARAVKEAARRFSELGATVEESDPPISDPMPVFKKLFSAGFAHSLGHLTAAQLERAGPRLLELMEGGKNLTLAEYMRALSDRRGLAQAMAVFHERYDLLLTPTLAVSAFQADRWAPASFEKYGDIRAWVPFGNLFNMSQQPAASVCCGYTSDGLPIGLQIAGRRFEDVLVLRAARAFEQAMPARVSPLAEAWENEQDAG